MRWGLSVDELFTEVMKLDLEIGFDSVNMIYEFTEDACCKSWAAYKPGKFTVTINPFFKI